MCAASRTAGRCFFALSFSPSLSFLPLAASRDGGRSPGRSVGSGAMARAHRCEPCCGVIPPSDGTGLAKTSRFIPPPPAFVRRVQSLPRQFGHDESHGTHAAPRLNPRWSPSCMGSLQDRSPISHGLAHVADQQRKSAIAAYFLLNIVDLTPRSSNWSWCLFGHELV